LVEVARYDQIVYLYTESVENGDVGTSKDFWVSLIYVRWFNNIQRYYIIFNNFFSI